MGHAVAPASPARLRARRLAACLVPLLAAVLVAGTPVPACAMTLAEYRDALLGIKEDAAALEHGTPPEADELAEEIEAALPLDESVEIGDASVRARDGRLTMLAEDLRDARTAAEIAEATGRIEARADALLEAVVGGGDEYDVPADAAALEAILATDEERPGTSLGEWLSEMSQKIAEWLGEILSRLFSGLAGSDVAAPDLSGAWPYFLGTAAAVAAGLLVFLAIRLVRWWRRREPKHVIDEDGPVIAAAEDLPPDALGYAERLAAAGRFREAVRALFGGAARTLVETGIIARAKTRTNGELLSDVQAGSPAIAPDLRTLADIFEAAWYGQRDPGSCGVDQARERYRAVVESATQPRGRDA